MGAFDLAVLLSMAVELHFAEYANNAQVRYFLKPIPMFLLIINLSFYRTKMARLINLGLILSVVGDILLSFKGIDNFLAGTVFFFLAHVVYIYTLRLPNSESSSSSRTNPLLYVACLVIYGIAVFSISQLYLVMPAKPLLVSYGLVLSTMTCFALTRYNLTTKSSYWYCLVGSVLFAASDNLLGTFKFNHIKSIWGYMSVMATYYLAQYFIMKGAIAHEPSAHEPSAQAKPKSQ